MERVASDRKIIGDFLSGEGLEVCPCSLVELVLGIWHSKG